MLIITENLINLLVKKKRDSTQQCCSRTSQKFRKFSVNTGKQFFKYKSLPCKCNIIARYITLLSTSKKQKKQVLSKMVPNFSKVSLKNYVSNLSENTSVIILSPSSSGEEGPEEYRGIYMAGRGIDRLLWQLMDKQLLKRKAHFGEWWLQEKELWLKGKGNCRNRLKIKSLVIKEILFWRILTETKHNFKGVSCIFSPVSWHLLWPLDYL